MTRFRCSFSARSARSGCRGGGSAWRWLALVALLAVSFAATGQQADGGQVLTVGLTSAPPFTIHEDDGQWTGVSVDLWKQIAERAGYDFRFREVSFEELLNGVTEGSLDVAIGALTMTAERESRFDFTHPFYVTGLSIGVPHEVEGGWWAAARALFSWEFASVVLALAALLLGVGFVVWLFERHANPEEFGGRPITGIGSSFWWAAVTMTTVGYGDKSPRTTGGRLVALVWMFAGLIMVSAFTAAITSALTVSHLKRGIKGPGDLRGADVATIEGTGSDAYLRNNRIRRTYYPDLESAVRAVASGRTEAIVYDRPLLQYRAQQMPDAAIDLLPGVFEEQNYAFALPTGSRLRETIDQQMLEVTGSGEWASIVSRYLGGSTAK